MYESPKLVTFGQFRDLTLQTPCMKVSPWTGKRFATFDPVFPSAGEGCEAVVRS